jgi:3-oxoacyl-[acyl-carrier protein] reductase
VTTHGDGSNGKVALITGASRGIGAASARRLARDGFWVAVNYVTNRHAADAVVGEIETAGGRAFALQADVASRDDRRRMFEAVIEACGRLDVLVNNAGADAFASLAEIDEDHLASLMGVNFEAVLFACQQAARLMDRAGGRIINITSIVARTPQPNRAVYGASKAAVEAITASFAAELGPRGITVNAVAPGSTETDMTRRRMVGAVRDAIVANTPLGRLGQPEDIAGLVAFLASDEAAWITGEVIAADGGRMDV